MKTLNDVYAMQMTKIVRVWNELCDKHTYNTYVMSRDEWYEYCAEDSREHLLKVLSNLKNFSSTARYFFLDNLGFYESFNTLEDANCPIDLDEVLEYLNENEED